jgi:hypothetical protein
MKAMASGNKRHSPRKKMKGAKGSLKLQRWKGKYIICGRILGGIGEGDLRRLYVWGLFLTR